MADGLNPLGIEQAGVGLIQGIAGLFQRHKANKLAKNNPFPDYSIPQEITTNQNFAKMRANTGLQGQQYASIEQNMARNSNAAMHGLQDRRGGIAGVTRLFRANNDAAINLGVQDANMRRANEQTLMNANNQMAFYKDKAFDWNKKAKYLQTAQRVAQMYGAANQNLTSGLDNIASGAVTTFDPDSNSSYSSNSNSTTDNSDNSNNNEFNPDYQTYLKLKKKYGNKINTQVR